MKKNNTVQFKPINSKRTFENIADEIKKLIYSRALKPGDRLPSERDMAVQFGTGRMAVREALRILEASGFLYIKPGAEGGVFVKELDSTGMTNTISDLIRTGNITLEELTEARISLESIIIEKNIKSITKKDLAALEENIKRSEEITSQADVKVNVWDNKPLINFHVLLAEGTENRLYKYFLQSLVDLSNSLISELLPNHIQDPDHINQHKAIYEAVKAKDLKEAKKAIQEHLYWVAEVIRKEIKFKNGLIPG
ncbi:MAG: FadR family transcriptional regulator [Deltaproteobacteria bacterium]|nr:FadR family transcriptional regulator [Deltaproteobacteria bacterium]